MFHRRNRRRGVILLVVLSILVLFVLLAVTFVIVATKEYSTTKPLSRMEASGDSPRDLLDALAMTLIRDTNDPHSPFRSWSLLEGIYGNASFRGMVNGAQVTPGTGGQMVTINVLNNSSGATPSATALGTPPSPAVLLPNSNFLSTSNLAPSTPNQWTYFSNIFSQPQHYYRGCVLTMITGKLAGLSTRIVDSSSTSNSVTLTVMQFIPDTTDGSGNIPLPESGAPMNATFVVTAPAYSGMGRGYDPTGGKNGAGGSGTYCGFQDPNNNKWEFALLPNPAYFQVAASTTPPYVDPAGPGGGNVDYTVADYNNMYLAMVAFDSGGNLKIMPSFHRPDLCAYWDTRASGLASNATLMRKVMFRPNPIDHPTFCATTNPGFDPRNPNQTYDVDNLGLGTPDSIWIDPGWPVMTSRDGRTYKVMVAPLILDMDGRVNLNAHGSYTQADPSYNQPLNTAAPVGNVNPPVAVAGGGGSAQVVVGMGTGPGNVNPTAVLTASDFNNIIGNGPQNSATLQGRHGTGISPSANPYLTALRFFDHPVNGISYAPLSSYGSPPDVDDRHGIAIDPRGNPLWLSPAQAGGKRQQWKEEVFGSTINASYGFDIGYRVPKPGRIVPQGLDNPFTVAEFERVVRQYDIDAVSMPVRLYNLIQNTLTSNPSAALKQTVESWDPPNPSCVAPQDLRANLSKLTNPATTSSSFIDLIRSKLTTCGLQNSDQELALILPPEVFAGLKMDINRPFGNGRNNRASNTGASPYPPLPVTTSSDHGIADEVLDGGNESLPGPGGLPVWPPSFPNSIALNLTPSYAPATGPSADPLINNNNIPAGWKQRQLMARYLYVMMMALGDSTFTGWISPNDQSATNPQVQQQLVARRIAQWAINAVTFRDSSSAMIPFVYDPQIFTANYAGWKPTGDPADVPGSKWGIVWGCKPPDLVLTESLAFHDLRVADTDKDDGPHKKCYDSGTMKPADPDYDQTRVPQGSTFLELYCCRNPNNPIAPGDLYSLVNGQWALDLGRMAPDAQGNPNVFPVWRMAVSQSLKINPQADMVTALQKYPETVQAVNYISQDKSVKDNGAILPAIQVNMFDATQLVNIERMIWLGNSPPPAAQRNSQTPPCSIYYNRNKQIVDPNNNNPNAVADQTYVQPGGYAVVGPRATTYVGSIKPNGSGPYGSPSTQSISLYPQVTTNATLNDMPAANIKQPTGVVVAADAPSGWTDPSHQTWGIGFNVSEPIPADPSAYYPEPLQPNAALIDKVTGKPTVDGYGDLTEQDASKPFRDQPLELPPAAMKSPPLPNAPLVKDGINKTCSTVSSGFPQGYKTVFLQRLADPTRAFDANQNPYITVDWLPIDLTVFNGEEDPNANQMGMPTGDPQDPSAAKPQVELYARQRGGTPDPNKPNAATKLYNVWTPVSSGDTFPTTPSTIGANANTSACFPYQVGHSLGYLNANFGPGYGNTAAGAAPPPQPQYIGDPTTPFPWITWNARPYISPMELLLVPASSPDRLLAEFSTLETLSPSVNSLMPSVTNYQPYQTATPNARGPFAHLLNFFSSADPTYTAGKASNFFRILDYVTVPSKFIGTETVLNPNVFATNNNSVPTWLQPPFNTVSNYRDPGKMNVNTIPSPDVWAALMNQPNAPKPSYNDWLDSLHGAATGGSPITTNTSLPTMFVNPLRSAACADLVPLSAMLNVGGHPRNGVDVTLLRPRVTGNANLPLFMSTDVSATANQRTPGGGDQPYADASVNPYFAYQTLQRISNNVTGRSNVFAIWLTIGYFEVIPNPPGIDAGHPDGYQIGAELGSDNGTVERHRAFYMFDRSIPVGYERGMNHNVNRAMLLRRFIE